MIERLVAEPGDPAAPPRRNGELVFEAPWESRAFGVALALAERDAYAWEDFRQRLIAEIGAREDEPWSYYGRWLAALEGLLLERGMLDADELEARVAAVGEEVAHEHDHDAHEHG